MRPALLALALVVLAAPVEAATLPLKDGDYSHGKCEPRSDINESIGIYTLSDGPKRGQRFISPNAEEQDGYCYLGNVAISGNRFSGSSKCRSGAKVDYSTGRYDFTYDVIDARTFVSKGVQYKWCADHDSAEFSLPSSDRFQHQRAPSGCLDAS